MSKNGEKLDARVRRTRDALGDAMMQLFQFLEAMSGWLARSGEVSERVAPVRELFAHVAESEKLYEAMIRSGRQHDFVALAQGYFARAIASRLAVVERSKDVPAEARATLAAALSGALLSLLRAWLAHRQRMSAAEADALFHRLVWSGIPAAERAG